MKQKRTLLLVILVLIPITHVSGIEVNNKFCFLCHNRPNLKHRTEQGAGLNLYQSKEVYEHSNHAKLQCTLCHRPEGDKNKAFITFPHKTRDAKMWDCLTCHRVNQKEIVSAYSESVHKVKQAEQFRCDNCHDPHNNASFEDRTENNGIQDRITYANKSCRSCHDDPAQTTSTGDKLLTVEQAHQSLMQPEMHLASLRCVDCHTAADDPSNHKITEKAETVSCVACHNSDSLLLTRLYHPPSSKGTDSAVEANSTGEEQSETLASGHPFSKLYLAGAFRVTGWLDGLIMGLMGLMIVVMGMHGGLRFVMGRKRNQSSSNMKIEEEPFYGIAVRTWHWSNALLAILLIASGFSIHFTGRDSSLIDFSSAIHLHQICGVMLIICYLFYLVSSIINGNLKNYLPRRNLVTAVIDQALYYLWGIIQGNPKPFHPTKEDKFNEIQRLSYIGMIFFILPLLAISGVALMYPLSVPEVLLGFDGLQLVASVHYCMATIFVLFLLVHLYQITTGERAHFLLKSMITGKHYTLKSGSE